MLLKLLFIQNLKIVQVLQTSKWQGECERVLFAYLVNSI